MEKCYSQCTNAATAAKWRRMCANRGRRNVKYLECGFSSWFLVKDDCGNIVVKASTTYHSEATLDEMYACNLNGWR